MRLFTIWSMTTLIFVACNTAKDEKSSVADSSTVTVSGETVTEKPVSDSIQSAPAVKTDLDFTKGEMQKQKNMSKSKIEVKTFANANISGYGYDIIVDGHTYVHQPNIPAVPGNNGFASEEIAKKVAGLVVMKIKKNIMPPTIDVKELDSLGAN